MKILEKNILNARQTFKQNSKESDNLSSILQACLEWVASPEPPL